MSSVPNPPRLLNSSAPGAYDWREFDRHIRSLTAAVQNIGAGQFPSNIPMDTIIGLTAALQSLSSQIQAKQIEGAYITEAPNDGKAYVRRNGAWEVLDIR